MLVSFDVYAERNYSIRIMATMFLSQTRIIIAITYINNLLYS